MSEQEFKEKLQALELSAAEAREESAKARAETERTRAEVEKTVRLIYTYLLPLAAIISFSIIVFKTFN